MRYFIEIVKLDLPQFITFANNIVLAIFGLVSNQDVECRAIRTDNGSLFTIASLPNEIAVGDRLSVEGNLQTDNICQQDTTLIPTKIILLTTEDAARNEYM